MFGEQIYRTNSNGMPRSPTWSESMCVVLERTCLCSDRKMKFVSKTKHTVHERRQNMHGKQKCRAYELRKKTHKYFLFVSLETLFRK